MNGSPLYTELQSGSPIVWTLGPYTSTLRLSVMGVPLTVSVSPTCRSIAQYCRPSESGHAFETLLSVEPAAIVGADAGEQLPGVLADAVPTKLMAAIAAISATTSLPLFRALHEESLGR